MNQPLPNKSLPMPSLRNIQAFIEVADTGSLTCQQRISILQLQQSVIR